MKTKFLVRAAIVVALVASFGVAVAQARLSNGGANIASAPTVAFGHQEFGNTSDGCFGGDCGNGYGQGASFWKLPLIAGDRVTVDWEATKTSGGCAAADSLDIWPAGTTDFSINNASTFQSFGIGSNNKAESSFTAGVTGVFPIMFEACGSDSDSIGPYDFTVYDRHAVVLSLASASKSLIINAHHAPIRHSGRLVFFVHTADGKPISGGVGATVMGYWLGSWHKLGAATARGGQISVGYQIPASVHGVIRLAVNIGGGSYQGRHISWNGIKA